MKAMVLAAGFGTRLRPLTEEVPKPLVPVLGRPLLEHTLRQLRSWGVEQVVINLHHLPEAIPAVIGDGSPLGLEVQYLVEEGEIRGTGGGVRGARELLDDGETFLVLNGDVLFEPDLPAALALHRRLGAEATMVLREDPRATAYGAVETDASGQVRRLLGRPASEGRRLRPAMFTGLHLLEPEVFDHLPARGCIVREFYVPRLEQGRVIGGFIDNGTWVELGTVRDYLAVNLALAAGTLKLAHLPPSPSGGCWIDPSARVADPAGLVPPLVIGREAEIRAPVERSVVWDGAVVESPVVDAVVTPRQVVTFRAGPDQDSGRGPR